MRYRSLQVDAEVFSAYECRSLPADLGKSHPGDISEPGLLAAVSLPPPSYGTEVFHGEVIDNTKLSRLQLEGVSGAGWLGQLQLSADSCRATYGDRSREPSYILRMYTAAVVVVVASQRCSEVAAYRRQQCFVEAWRAES